ncbi:LpxI family protein [Roseicitreum antarcticum]|uniref:Phosphatidate cytidylyltransferase n=1 Tax=Roseicitreum antarcticum TaxID=564137 RepID=A0A1H3BRF8_9RHOB|nr:UDP-2,3-diacylglucosamine diphosphatase LpxI [Roseicitreum antarcticum]SDX44335.1 hypothetical protein SAMN04488238_108148 [Roseicitreum antarcticum]
MNAADAAPPAKVALIAGGGALPAHLWAALNRADTPTLIATPEGGQNPDGLIGQEMTPFRLERLLPFLDNLVANGVSHVVFAGAVTRPRLDPALIDPKTATLLPRIMAALPQGDDATLREIIAMFEEWGLCVLSADQIAPDLLPPEGVLGDHQPDAGAKRDVARAKAIVQALGTVDVGQGCVVAQGLCLAVEALPGTDTMLAQVAAWREKGGRGGVFFKAPKPGQDRRIDLPVIGPDTLRAVHAAGLAGLAIVGGGVMLLDRARAVALADELGLFLWVTAP